MFTVPKDQMIGMIRHLFINIQEFQIILHYFLFQSSIHKISKGKTLFLLILSFFPDRKNLQHHSSISNMCIKWIILKSTQTNFDDDLVTFCVKKDTISSMSTIVIRDRVWWQNSHERSFYVDSVKRNLNNSIYSMSISFQLNGFWVALWLMETWMKNPRTNSRIDNLFIHINMRMRSRRWIKVWIFFIASLPCVWQPSSWNSIGQMAENLNHHRKFSDNLIVYVLHELCIYLLKEYFERNSNVDKWMKNSRKEKHFSFLFEFVKRKSRTFCTIVGSINWNLWQIKFEKETTFNMKIIWNSIHNSNILPFN